MKIWFVSCELGTAAQFVPGPVLKPFIWICNDPPRWSCGQESCNWLPLIRAARLVAAREGKGAALPPGRLFSRVGNQPAPTETNNRGVPNFQTSLQKKDDDKLGKQVKIHITAV